jgi:hypothetical protein
MVLNYEGVSEGSACSTYFRKSRPHSLPYHKGISIVDTDAALAIIQMGAIW